MSNNQYGLPSCSPQSSSCRRLSAEHVTLCHGFLLTALTATIALTVCSVYAQRTAGLDPAPAGRLTLPAAGSLRIGPSSIDINAEPRTELGIPYSVERAMQMDGVTPDAWFRELPFAPEPATLRVSPLPMLRLSPPVQLRIQPNQQPLELRMPSASPFPVIEE